jgi:hypothetical protein
MAADKEKELQSIIPEKNHFNNLTLYQFPESDQGLQLGEAKESNLHNITVEAISQKAPSLQLQEEIVDRRTNENEILHGANVTAKELNSKYENIENIENISQGDVPITPKEQEQNLKNDRVSPNNNFIDASSQSSPLTSVEDLNNIEDQNFSDGKLLELTIDDEIQGISFNLTEKDSIILDSNVLGLKGRKRERDGQDEEGTSLKKVKPKQIDTFQNSSSLNEIALPEPFGSTHAPHTPELQRPYSSNVDEKILWRGKDPILSAGSLDSGATTPLETEDGIIPPGKKKAITRTSVLASN